MDNDNAEVRRFIDASTAFISWVETYDADKSGLIDLHKYIADLQAALLRLPQDDRDEESEDVDEATVDLDAIEPDDATDSDQLYEQRASLIERLSTLPITHYRVIFDALEDDPDGLVTGSLADDLSDIHQDLQRGLDEWAAGNAEEAIWEWRFRYFTHWGRHATHAQSAILDYLRDEADY